MFVPTCVSLMRTQLRSHVVLFDVPSAALPGVNVLFEDFFLCFCRACVFLVVYSLIVFLFYKTVFFCLAFLLVLPYSYFCYWFCTRSLTTPPQKKKMKIKEKAIIGAGWNVYIYSPDCALCYLLHLCGTG
uniref:Uncharacterized protein n=1 Tax=Trypanosoma congolense (strain IL3000) TaxID=1068625 RepID=G0ULB0_TRYCI|nr:hypothetical protein, unlikely [Trypanosoma congolense IL3000]